MELATFDHGPHGRGATQISPVLDWMPPEVSTVATPPPAGRYAVGGLRPGRSLPYVIGARSQRDRLQPRPVHHT